MSDTTNDSKPGWDDNPTTKNKPTDLDWARLDLELIKSLHTDGLASGEEVRAAREEVFRLAGEKSQETRQKNQATEEAALTKEWGPLAEELAREALTSQKTAETVGEFSGTGRWSNYLLERANGTIPEPAGHSRGSGASGKKNDN